MIKLLRAAAAGIHDDAHGAYLMHDACRNPDHTVALYLMEQGARVDLIRQHDRCSLLIAAAKAGNRPLVGALLERSVALDGQDHDGNTAALHAAKRGELDLVVRLAAHGASLDRRNFDRESIRDLVNRTPAPWSSSRRSCCKPSPRQPRTTAPAAPAMISPTVT